MAYPIVVLSFALIVLIALVAFIVPVFVGVFEEFGGELPVITKFTVALCNVLTGYWYLMILVVAGVVFAFRKWKSSDDRARAVGPLPPAHPVQDRRHRPEDLAGALVAHAQRARERRRPAAAGARDHRPDRGQPRRRERDGRRHRQRRRPAARSPSPLKSAPVFPGMVCPMVGVGEETGALDDDALEDRRLLRGPGRRGGQGADLDPRAGHDRRRRRRSSGFIVISMYLPLFKVYDQIR